jgi:hypothetical protein
VRLDVAPTDFASCRVDVAESPIDLAIPRPSARTTEGDDPSVAELERVMARARTPPRAVAVERSFVNVGPPAAVASKNPAATDVPADSPAPATRSDERSRLDGCRRQRLVAIL